MPMRRKYAPKRRLVRRKRLMRKRGLARATRPRRFGAGGGVYVKRRIDLTTIYNNSGVSAGAIVVKQAGTLGSTWISFGTPSLIDGGVAGSAGTAIYDIPFSMNFKLADITSYTDFTSIADKYKIAGVSVKMLLNGQTPAYTNGGPNPYIQYVYDHDDATVPTVAELTQKMGLRTKTFGSKSYCNLYVKPTPTGDVNQGQGAVVMRRAPWLDCADNDIPHYGVKGVIRNFNLASVSGLTSILSFDPVVTLVLKDLQ